MNQDVSKGGWLDASGVDQASKTQTQQLSQTENLTNGANNVSGKQIEIGIIDQLPMFDIVATKTIEEEGPEKKYVLYTVRVRHGTPRADLHTTTIERRYTDFLNLYDGLKKDSPGQMGQFTFPKKAVMGNFTQKLIEERRIKFESFLEFIVKDPKLRGAPPLLNFLQEKELRQALEWCGQQRYDLATPLFKKSFRLLNKVYTDRSPAVLLALCRLIGSYSATPGALDGSSERWASLALHRYEGVSDSDLLTLYGPLLEACIKLWDGQGKDKSALSERLADMKRRGINLETKGLLDAVADVEEKIRGMPNVFL